MNGTATRPRRKQSYHVALELQTLLLEDCRNKDTKPAVRAVCARTWEILEERKRVLRMKPLPKSIDVSQAKEQRRQARLARRPPDPNFLEVEKGISSSDTPGGTPTPGEEPASTPSL